MAHTDIAWKQIGWITGTGIVGILIGTLIVAPMLQKRKAKKLDEKKKQAPAKK